MIVEIDRLSNIHFKKSDIFKIASFMEANISFNFCIILICSVLFSSCNHESNKERIIKRELSNFLGLEINHDKLELLPINNEENQNIEAL